MKKNMFISVEPGDICGIGDTTFWPEENGGNTAICVPNSDVNMSYILLRNVLAAIGSEYKVWRIEDGNEDDVIFFTNLPRYKYEEAIKDSVFNGNNSNSIYVNTFAEGSILCPDEEQEEENDPTPKTLTAVDVKDKMTASEAQKKLDELKTMVVKMEATLEAFRDFGIGCSSEHMMNLIDGENGKMNDGVILSFMKLDKALGSLAFSAHDTEEKVSTMLGSKFSSLDDSDFNAFVARHQKEWADYMGEEV